VGAADVLSPDGSGESILRVVCCGKHLVLVVERNHTADRTEDLFADEPHIGLGVGDDRRLVEVTMTVHPLAAGDDLRAA
jgi:hypothetical protein